MTKRLGLYPGTQNGDGEKERPTIEAWFGTQNGAVSAHEAGIFTAIALRLLLGWEHPCIAYVEK